MVVNLDISHILKDWPYKPGQVTARHVRGEDGKEFIQLRLDVGLLQMEATGRPDGQRPHGYESLLAYYEERLRRHKEERGIEEGFVLDERDCELLRAESLMYYHRYLAEFVLEEFEAVERDTRRNLRVMDLCAAFAAESSDRHVLEQYRPYVVMMLARARAQIQLRNNRPKGALAALDQGVKDIEAFFKRYGHLEMSPNSGELAVLRAMAKEVEARIPVDPISKLKKALRKAVQDERYEEAAGLRDQIHRATRGRVEGAGPEGPEDSQ